MSVMNEKTPQIQPRKFFGDLTDFVQGYDKNTPLDIDVVVNEKGQVLLFHTLPFTREISWFEFDLTTYKLDFVLDDGEVRDAGLPLTADMSKYMQNSHQILTIFMDNDTGEAQKGTYIPLIIHKT